MNVVVSRPDPGPLEPNLICPTRGRWDDVISLIPFSIRYIDCDQKLCTNSSSLGVVRKQLPEVLPEGTTLFRGIPYFGESGTLGESRACP